MANVIESSGSIETICVVSAIHVGDTVRLVFRALDDSEPPYTCKVTSPTGEVILERVLRDLPTGRPQSAPPISFTAVQSGDYRVDVWQLYGKSRGQAAVHVKDSDPDP